MLRFLRRIWYGLRFTVAYARNGVEWDEAADNASRFPRMGSMHPERAELYLAKLACGIANTLSEQDGFIVMVFGPQVHVASSIADHEATAAVLEAAFEAAKNERFTDLETGD